MTHPLLHPVIVAAVERAASAHRGRPWTASGFTDLNDRAAHPSGILHGTPFSVFAKLSQDADSGGEQFAAELKGLELIARLAAIRTPTQVATGVVSAGTSWLLLSEALPERVGEARTPEDYRAIGHTLAALHQVNAHRFGLSQFNGFFGPFSQDNRPVGSDRWTDFYAERRVQPMLRLAVDSGNLPTGLADRTERLIERLPDLCGPEPRPSLLHGDAQQNNFICTADSAIVIDAAPYFGHPELDLALLDYFEPVSLAAFDGYQEIRPIDDGFDERRELWRIFSYLAVIAAVGQIPFGSRFVTSLANALDRNAR
ncbi:MAG TPA: fructosamine kinase family protein [Streptosporangiaceae bacterium]|nr:fructosamine kinase family protein [Streptosporangiaceae bacterium]